MNTAFMNRYFGPLPKEYCAYFYFLSVLFGLYFIIIVFAMFGYSAMNFNKLNVSLVFKSFYVLLSVLVIYFANRLLHTMCLGSIH